MESEQENQRGILRLTYVVVTIGGVYCLERVQVTFAVIGAVAGLVLGLLIVISTKSKSEKA